MLFEAFVVVSRDPGFPRSLDVLGIVPGVATLELMFALVKQLSFTDFI